MSIENQFFELLEADHDKIENILNRIAQTDDRGVSIRRKLLGNLTDALISHTNIEREVVYDLLKENTELRELGQEAENEHELIDHLLSSLASTPFQDVEWLPRFLILKESIDGHFAEEEGEIFLKMRTVLDPVELVRLGESVQSLMKVHKAA